MKTSSGRLLRLLDANINRAFEGLRVCEDIVRFCLNAQRQFLSLRAIRHALASAVRRLPIETSAMVQFRDSRYDPGKRLRASTVRSLEQLLLINFQRTKEALRVLEETSRLIAPRQVGAFQRLRFRAYDAERLLLLHVAALRHR